MTPVFNDWPSFCILLGQLDHLAASLPELKIFVTAVDDGSTESALTSDDLPALTHLQGAEIAHLAVNVGHQRAIAIGLCLAVEDADSDAIVVMDADGEDPPPTIRELLARAAKTTNFLIVAERRKRTENATFQLSYMVYKTVFRIVTGKKISFGNFSLISMSYARRLVMIPDLWNNLPAAVLRSRLPVQRVPIDRGTRYAGTSKMNFTSLIVHGLSGISVYADTIFVRLLLLAVGLVVFSAIAIGTVLALRIFVPAHATPGWATTVTFGMAIIVLQVFFTTLTSILMLLNNRVQRLVMPYLDFKPYIDTRRLLFGSEPSAAGPLPGTLL